MIKAIFRLFNRGKYHRDFWPVIRIDGVLYQGKNMKKVETNGRA